MRQLKGRMLAIAEGRTRLAPAKVEAYRELWKSQGYELPDLSVQLKVRPLVGTALHDLLDSFGVKSKKNCACNAKAAEMDRKGLQWCEEHIDELADWLTTAARKRKWMRLVPFKRFGAKRLIRMAIERAKTAAGI